MNPSPEHVLRRLKASRGVRRIAIAKAMEKIGHLIDLSGDLASEDGTTLALQWCDDLQARRLSSEQSAQLEYFRANAWANRKRLRHQSSDSVWHWDQPELQNEILCLRRALTHQGFEHLHAMRRCQILTNLANQLNTVGRFVDALEYWQRALNIHPRFAMALGNRGYGLVSYANSLYDPGHQRRFLWFAHKSFTAALASDAVYESAHPGPRAFFRAQQQRIEKFIDAGASARLDDWSLGRSAQEQSYRGWCLRNTLFLNPLNDLGAYAIAAQDVLMLPSDVTPLKEGPTLIGFFNQMKQEFASARWLLYEALHSSEVHFSDRGVKLNNTLDYPSYALAIEKMKVAFRVAYSLFDKIAFFINDYMRLGVAADAVYFRRVWYERSDRNHRKLRSQFTNAENWPLRGLYWLAKYFVEEGFRDVMEPDSQALYEIRNHLEHKYLKVHEMLMRNPNSVDAAHDIRYDRLAYSVKRSDLRIKTLRLFRLSRAALIYLALGMHREEVLRAKGKKPKLTAPMALPTLEDTWKS